MHGKLTISSKAASGKTSRGTAARFYTVPLLDASKHTDDKTVIYDASSICLS